MTRPTPQGISSKSIMLGPSCHSGPGGRSCNCCNEAPGKARRGKRRNRKRGERNSWRRSVRKGDI